MHRFLQHSFIIVLLLFVLFPIQAFSSTPIERGNTIPLIDYLHLIEQKYDIKFSYSVSMWKDIEIITEKQDENLEQVLIDLSDKLPLKLKKVGDNFYAILPVESSIKLRLRDARSKDLISVAYLSVDEKEKKLYFANGDDIIVEGILPSDSLTINSTFYKSLSLNASSVFNGKNDIALENKIHNINEVVVLPEYMTKGIDLMASEQTIRVKLESLSSIAGETDGDLYQAVKALPGISSPSGLAGTIFVRGNPFDFNLVQIDDIPIYHSGHLNGSLSPFNPGIINHVDINRNNVTIENGGKVGAMIDIHTRNDLLESLKADVFSNFVYSGFDFSTPVIKNKLGVQLSLRSSNNFLQNDLKFKEISDLQNQGTFISEVIMDKPENTISLDQRFYDINSKIVFKPNDKNDITLSAIYIKNEFNFDATQQISSTRKIVNTGMDNYGATFLWQSKWSNRVNTKFSVTASEHTNSNYEDEIAQDQLRYKNLGNTIKDLKLYTHLNYYINDNNNIKVGYEYKHHAIDNFTEDPIVMVNDTSFAGSIQSGFLKYKNIAWHKLRTTAGIRASYFSNTNSFTFDKLINLNYIASNNLIFKSSFSQIHQYLRHYFKDNFGGNPFRQNWIMVNKPEEVMRSNQFMMGGIYRKGKWLIDIEAYHNNINGVPDPLSSPDFPKDNTPTPGGGPPPSSDILVKGTDFGFSLKNIQTMGVDVLLKRKWGQADLWLSYTLSSTKLDKDTTTKVFYDRTHLLNFTAIYPVKRWTFSVNWNISSGLPVLPFKYHVPQQTDISNLIPYKDRYPAQHQLDLSITSKILMKQKRVSGIIGLSILNVYDKENIVNNFSDILHPFEIYRYGIGFAPNLQIKLMFR